jgi:hypothetical protein
MGRLFFPNAGPQDNPAGIGVFSSGAGRGRLRAVMVKGE